MNRKTITISLCLLLSAALPAASATLHVGDGQAWATIQAAVDAAFTGDEIIVHNGTYVEQVTVNKQLEIRSQSWIDHGLNSGAIIDVDAVGDVHAMIVTAGGTTIEGLSFMGATGWVLPDYDYANGIFVDGADDCVIANNRVGWEGAENGNSVSVRLLEAQRTHFYGNHVDGLIHSLWMEDSSNCLIEDNELVGASNSTYSSGIYMMGSYDAPAPALSCTRNLISNNEIRGNAVGVNFLDTCFRNTVDNNDIVENYIGVYGPSGPGNVISRNTIARNGNRGIHFNGAGESVIIDNLIDDNNNGIWLGYSSPADRGSDDNLIMRNRIINNSYCGLRITEKSDDNRMFLNFFAGNLHNVLSYGTSWETATPVSYYYNSNWGGPLGNYYDTYTGTDTDGDGIGDTDLPFTDGDTESGPVEYYPLVSPPNGYALQAWYLQGDDPKTMYHDDESRLVGESTIGAHTTHVWISDEPAAEALSFSSGAWTGHMRFASLATLNQVAIEIGTSTDGTDFTASGASVIIGGDWNEAFTTSAAPVSVAAGDYLAVRVNNMSDWDFVISTGGAATYVSGPGIGDPYWPYASAAFVPPAETSLVRLAQNHPNPFNPATVIAFDLQEAATVDLRVFDLAGRLVRTLIDGRDYTVGAHDVPWLGRDDTGRAVASGVYVYRVEAGGESVARRMVLVR